MKKIAILMMLAALVFAGCANDGDSGNDASGNTSGNGNSGNNSGSSSTGSGDSDTNILDIYTTQTFSMKVGELVILRASCDEGHFYSFTYNTNNSTVELHKKLNMLTANANGTATVKIFSKKDTSKELGRCEITVTAADSES